MVDDMAELDFAGLGRAVRRRREDLGLSLSAVRDRGGPAVATLQKIEAGQPADYRATTIRPLEAVLAWAPGSVQLVLDGLEAVEMITDEDELMRAMHKPQSPTVEMLTAMSLLNIALDTAAATGELTAVVALIEGAQDRLNAAATTLGVQPQEVLPQHLGPGNKYGRILGARKDRSRQRVNPSAGLYEPLAADVNPHPTEAELRDQHEAEQEDAAAAEERRRQDESDGGA